MKYLSALLTLALAPVLSLALVFPGADGPSFYLIAVSLGTSSVRPVLFDSSSGAVTLQDNGPKFPAQNYFQQGHLRCSLDRTGDPNYRAYIDTGFTGTGSCATFGKLGYLEGSTTNKCATYPKFQLQANKENAQLGSRLTINHVGGFFACGPDEEIWYKQNEWDGPTNCMPFDLYTVPVV
ncbi:hypothetical protein MD484_g290, partial [Candolleomyces efflorescens]